jgi:hypothetical protein
MRPGYNPIRRNRNIGTAKQGHGQNNRLTIPERWNGRAWTEELQPHTKIVRTVADRLLTFYVEENHGGCAHACTIADICHLLAQIPAEDWEGISNFVLRQPTLKQRTLSPVWGRLRYSADLGRPGDKPSDYGPALMLEACRFDHPIKWGLHLDPDDLAEIERLRADGHAVERTKRNYLITPTAESTRATQLYRTLLHEIGHWVDYLEKVKRPDDAGQGNWDDLRERYFARPADEREAFAHAYADRLRAKLLAAGIIPFAPIADEVSSLKQGEAR